MKVVEEVYLCLTDQNLRLKCSGTVTAKKKMQQYRSLMHRLTESGCLKYYVLSKRIMVQTTCRTTWHFVTAHNWASEVYFAGTEEQLDSVLMFRWKIFLGDFFCQAQELFFLLTLFRWTALIINSNNSMGKPSQQALNGNSLVKHTKQLGQFLLRLPFAVVFHASHHHYQELIKVHRAAPCTHKVHIITSLPSTQERPFFITSSIAIILPPWL